MNHSSQAQPSRMEWKHIDSDFSFMFEPGLAILANIDWLSPNIDNVSSTGTPIMRSLYLMPRTNSQACFIATISDPYVLVSHDPCFLDLQEMGAEFNNTMNPVLERRVTWSPAWSLSTNTHTVMLLPPSGHGIFLWITSFKYSSP